MENIELNKICNRLNEEKLVTDFLKNYDNIINNNNQQKSSKNSSLEQTYKKGLYIYGDSGTGKTKFILDLLKKNNYDIVYYNSGDIRNKNIIETITKYNMSDKSILSLLNKKVKRPVIVMDEIDGMMVGDKGGISSLIKIIRPKKTKKQKNEDDSLNPIICIGNYHTDKKIKDLLKVCLSIELKKITDFQINNILEQIMPYISANMKNNIINYIDGNLRKLSNLYNIYTNDKDILNNDKIFNEVFHFKSYNCSVNNIISKLLHNKYEFSQHIKIINETDRTIMGLNFHENIVDLLNYENNISVPIYINFLENICFSDYIDRITFQKQIWQFNEMSSLIKTFKNNKLIHEKIEKYSNRKIDDINIDSNIRFTKILTKYSSEYNNSVFIQNLCQKLMIDKKDVFSFFSFLKIIHNSDINEISNLFENYEITKLDINRIYKYIEKTIKDADNIICDYDDHNIMNEDDEMM